MADFLGTNLSTYIKWETNKSRVKPIPKLAADKLAESDELDLSALTIAEIDELDQLARAKGLPLVKLAGEFIREGIRRAKGIVPILAAGALLGFIAYQLSHPDKASRRFARRDECAVEGILAEA